MCWLSVSEHNLRGLCRTDLWHTWGTSNVTDSLFTKPNLIHYYSLSLFHLLFFCIHISLLSVVVAAVLTCHYILPSVNSIYHKCHYISNSTLDRELIIFISLCFGFEKMGSLTSTKCTNLQNIITKKYANWCIFWDKLEHSVNTIRVEPKILISIGDVPSIQECTNKCMEFFVTLLVKERNNNSVQMWELWKGTQSCPFPHDCLLRHPWARQLGHLFLWCWQQQVATVRLSWAVQLWKCVWR